MKSAVVRRSVLVGGHTTSVTLEDAFWVGLREIAAERGVCLSDLVGDIDMKRTNSNLSSTLRLFVFDHYCHRAAAPSLSGAATQAAESNRIPAKSVLDAYRESLRRRRDPVGGPVRTPVLRAAALSISFGASSALTRPSKLRLPDR